MANEAWRAGIARCPHYVRSNARTITCSPSGEEDDEIRRRLKSSEACAEWFRQYCARRYSKCPCYEIIDKVLEEAARAAPPAGKSGPYGGTTGEGGPGNPAPTAGRLPALQR